MWRAPCYPLSQRFDMLPKFVASWLVVLVLAPFTAPFSTCDLTSLFGNVQDLAPVARSAAAPAWPGRRVDLRRSSTDPMAPASAELLRDVAVPSVPVASTAGRSRPLLLLRVFSPLPAVPASSFSSRQSAASSGCVRGHASLAAVLRV